MNETVQSIIETAKTVAAEEFDELYPVDDSDKDQSYYMRRKAEVTSNAGLSLSEYSVNLNEAIIRIIVEMMEEELYKYLGEEYSSVREWAHSKYGDIVNQRTLNRWIRSAISMYKTYMEGHVSSSEEAMDSIDITRAEVIATARDMIEDDTDRREVINSIIKAKTTSDAKEILSSKTVKKPKGVLIVEEKADGSVDVRGNITTDQLAEWMVSLTNHVEFRLSE